MTKLLQTIDNEPDLTPNFNPILLDSLEQDLILRYLRARCHPNQQLHAQGITLPPDVAAAIPPFTPRKAATTSTAPADESPSRKRSNSKTRNKGSNKASFKGPIPIQHFRSTPFPGREKRTAIALDCEMVTVETGVNEIAFLSAVDFLTGEILINNYVQPSQKVINWNTRSSGLTPSIMNRAVSMDLAILGGWDRARQMLWDFMDADTVLIGHSIQNDLNVLGMFHSRIVDSSILTAAAVYPELPSAQRLTRTWALKTLAKELLDYDIQNRKKGHSALEDALATRDVVIWCIRYPEELRTWAEDARKKEDEREVARQQEQAKKREERERKKREEELAELLDAETNIAVAQADRPSGTGWDGTDERTRTGREEPLIFRAQTGYLRAEPIREVNTGYVRTEPIRAVNTGYVGIDYHF